MATPVAGSLSPKDIEPALGKLRESMKSDNDKVSFGLSSSGNIIIVGSGENNQRVLDEYQAAFMAAQPARFFLVELKEIEAPHFSVNAICHRLGKSDHVCSEIISLEVPNAYLPRLASILRSHLVPGALTECCLVDEESLAKVFSSIMQVPDVVYVDSARVRSGIKAIGQIAGNTRKLIDINWLRTAAWRKAIRMGFDAIKFSVAIEDLEKVRITSIQDRNSRVTGSGALLVAGWILSRLEMQLVSVSGAVAGKVESANATLRNVHTGKAHTLPILFNEISIDNGQLTETNAAGNIYSVELEFGGSSKQTLTLMTTQTGRILIKGSGCKEFSAEYDVPPDNTSAGLLRRLLLIGESQKNFTRSLAMAVDIASGVDAKINEKKHNN